MLTLSTNMLAHLEQETTTLAQCWLLTREDGKTFGFTTHDEDLTFGGQLYESNKGYSQTATELKSGLSVDDVDLVTFLDSEVITEAELRAGKYDRARLDIFLVNYESFSDGKIYLLKGWRLGLVEIRDEQFFTTVKSITSRLQTPVLEVYAPTCGCYELGDARCGVDVAGSFTDTGTVTSVSSRRTFIDTSLTAVNHYYQYGLLTWTSGANNNIASEVKDFTSSTDTVDLVDKMPYDIDVGDTFTITAGCDRTFSVCRDIFSNVDNFRGFPHVPGQDKILEYPGISDAIT